MEFGDPFGFEAEKTDGSCYDFLHLETMNTSYPTTTFCGPNYNIAFLDESSVGIKIS